MREDLSIPIRQRVIMFLLLEIHTETKFQILESKCKHQEEISITRIPDPELAGSHSTLNNQCNRVKPKWSTIPRCTTSESDALSSIFKI